MSIEALRSSPEIHAHVWTDPVQTALEYKNEAFKADIKAKASFVALAIITVVGVTLAAIYMQPLIPVVLIIAGSAANGVYNKFYLPYRQESMKQAKLAKLSFEIADKVDSYAKENLSGSELSHKLFQHGIVSTEIKHKDVLTAMDPDQDTCRSLRNLIGRVEYWSEAAKKAEAKIAKFDRKIQKKETLMYAPGIDPEKQKKVKMDWLYLNEKKHKTEEEKYLPYKLAAAYNLHVIDNIKDLRTPQSFGRPEPSSFIEASTWKEKTGLPYYFFAQDADRKPLSKKWMMENSIQTFAKQIFGAPSLMLA